MFFLRLPWLSPSSVYQTKACRVPHGRQDGLALLKEVGRQHADWKSYHIAALEKRNSNNRLERGWQKSLMKAVVTPGGRYRYQGRSGYGAAMSVSDVARQWT